MEKSTSQYNYLCSKCGGVIKAGEPFYYFYKEDGKPVRLRVHIGCVKEKDGTTRKVNQ